MTVYGKLQQASPNFSLKLERRRSLFLHFADSFPHLSVGVLKAVLSHQRHTKSHRKSLFCVCLSEKKRRKSLDQEIDQVNESRESFWEWSLVVTSCQPNLIKHLRYRIWHQQHNRLHLDAYRIHQLTALRSLRYSLSKYTATGDHTKVWVSCGHIPQKSAGYVLQDTVEDICPKHFSFLKHWLHWRVRKCPTIPTPEAANCHNCVETNLENTQPQKTHGQKMMRPTNAQLKHALRAKTWSQES